MQKVDRGEVSIDGDRVVEHGGASMSEKELTDGAQNYWDKLESEWEDLSKNSESHRWLAEYESMSSMYKVCKNLCLAEVCNRYHFVSELQYDR